MLRKRLWFSMTALLLALLATSFAVWRLSSSFSVDRLLEQAYFEQRPLELRISRTPRSSVRVQRGQEISRMDRPQSLLEAEAAIAAGLRKNPGEVALLTVRGQANLLEWSYEAAITDLQQTLDQQPKSALVLNSLATAYFERAQASNRFEDYGTAFELQSRALVQSPDDTIALFNRAITASRLYLFKQSMEDWQRYLILDAGSDWSAEARLNLDEVSATVEAHDKRTKSPLLTPAEFARTVDLTDSKTWATVEPRIDDYLSAALTDWLPSAFPVGAKAPASAEAIQALRTLAVVLQRQHGDSWLDRLMSTEKSTEFKKAIVALQNAVYANEVTGDYLLARRESERAEELFSRAENGAGAVRAELEKIRALHFSDEARECIREIANLTARLTGLPFEMIRIEAQLEGHNCLSLDGQIDRSADLADRAYELARHDHYQGLALAAKVFLAESASAKSGEDGWEHCIEGLKQYWSASNPSKRAYGLYVVMDVMSAKEEMWRLDFAIGSQIVSLLPTQDPLMRAEEFLNLAHAAQMAEEAGAARANLSIAKRLFLSAPQTRVTENYRLDLEIYQAWADGRLGKSEVAVDRLVALKPQLDGIHNETLSAKYHRTLGALEEDAGNFAGAEAEFDSAVLLAERERSSLKFESERITWAEAAEESYQDLVDVRLRQQNAYGALEALELYRGAALRTASLSPGDLPDGKDDEKENFEAALSRERNLISHVEPSSNEQTILVYDLLPRGLAIWVYDERGLDLRFVEKNPADVRMLAHRMGEICATPYSSIASVQATAQELYRTLVAPVSEQIRNRQTLIIESGDALVSVPFQVLLESGGRYLSEYHSIAYSPGLPYLDGLRKDDNGLSSATKALIVAIGGGRGISSLGPLPDTVSEAKNISRHFAEPQVLTEDQASIAAIRDGLSQAALFHFAGHAGEVNGRRGLIVTSPLAPGDVLDSSALERMSLSNLQLAVLSACSTGNSARGTFLVDRSLVRTFMRAGVPHIVATRWDVDSRSSSVLMERFYDLLFSGVRVPRALAVAESDFRKSFAHPYYWAGFDAFGLK
jgi:CHAT domain-containing protein